ncbi:integral membrane protein, partial [Streptomyces coelicoflavus ZG0656]
MSTTVMSAAGTGVTATGAVGAGELWTGVALVCLGAAAWLGGGWHSGVRRARRVLAEARVGRTAGTGETVGTGGAGGTGPPSPADRVTDGLRRIRGRLRPEWGSLAAGLVLALLGDSVLPVVAGAAGVPLLRRTRLAGRERRVREHRQDAVIALCGTLAGEVRSGRQPGEALLGAAHDCNGLGDGQAAVLAAARFGGDVPGALAAAAGQPGAEGLRG